MSSARLSRRSALGLGAASLAALALGGLGLSTQMTRMRSPRRPLKAFSPQQFSVLAALSIVVSPGAEGVPSGWDLEVPENLDATLARGEPGLAKELGMGLLLLENSALRLLTEGEALTFTQASPEQQARVLQSWRNSRLTLRRSVSKAFITLCSATYWATPQTWTQVDYPGPGLHLGAR